MTQWEYFSTFIEANARSKENQEFLKRRFPDRKKFRRYTPESLMPELDKLGAEGWELVHMEPVAQVGGKGDVLFTGSVSQWSKTYFCVFKRAKSQPQAPAPQPAPAAPSTPTES